MGFRFIRDVQRSKTSKNQIKDSELLKEITRWSRLTQHTEKDCDDFINHYQEVLSSHKNQAEHGKNLARDLGDLIKDRKVNLVNIQGNLEIDRLMELISDVQGSPNE